MYGIRWFEQMFSFSVCLRLWGQNLNILCFTNSGNACENWIKASVNYSDTEKAQYDLNNNYTQRRKPVMKHWKLWESRRGNSFLFQGHLQSYIWLADHLPPQTRSLASPPQKSCQFLCKEKTLSFKHQGYMVSVRKAGSVLKPVT